MQQVLLERAHHQRHVGLAHQRQLLVALGDRGMARAAAGVEIRVTLFAQKMQVHRVEHDERVRSERAQGIEVLHRDVMARHQNHVELGATRVEKRARPSAHTARNSTSTPLLLQLRHVRLPVLEIVGDERHLAA